MVNTVQKLKERKKKREKKVFPSKIKGFITGLLIGKITFLGFCWFGFFLNTLKDIPSNSKFTQTVCFIQQQVLSQRRQNTTLSKDVYTLGHISSNSQR